MDDQGMIRWSAFGRVNARNSRWIFCVSTKAVDGFGRKGDQTALLQHPCCCLDEFSVHDLERDAEDVAGLLHMLLRCYQRRGDEGDVAHLTAAACIVLAIQMQAGSR